MNTADSEADGRRRHSPEFKADAIAAYRQRGVSIAAVALSRGLDANLLRRWLADSESEAGVDGAGEPVTCDDASATVQPASAPHGCVSGCGDLHRHRVAGGRAHQHARRS